MNATANNTASPFALRPDLKVMPMGGREPHFVIEDPLRGSFFRLGVAEYDALRQLTQLRGSAEILESSNARFGAEALTESRLRELLTWARQAGLLRESEKTPSGEAEIRGDAGLRIASPLFMRVSLGAPGPWVERIHAAGAWLFSRQIVFLWLTVMAWVGVQAWTNFPELIASWDNLASPSRALGAVVLWLVIKVLHEMGHAIACRRAGGEVRDAGFRVHMESNGSRELRARVDWLTISPKPQFHDGRFHLLPDLPAAEIKVVVDPQDRRAGRGEGRANRLGAAGQGEVHQVNAELHV